MSMNVVFLDRDGTINVDEGYFHKPDTLVFITGALDGIQKIHTLGYGIIIITNQSGIAKGKFTEDTMRAVNEKILKVLEKNNVVVQGLYYCPHCDGDACLCRKPKTGMIEQAVQDHDIDLSGSWLIGDSTSDIGAAVNMKKKFPGFRSIGVMTGNKLQDNRVEAKPDFVAATLLEAAKIIEKTK